MSKSLDILVIYSRGGPSSYIYCVIYFCIEVTPCTGSVVFWLLYTFDGELKHPWIISICILQIYFHCIVINILQPEVDIEEVQCYEPHLDADLKHT